MTRWHDSLSKKFQVRKSAKKKSKYNAKRTEFRGQAFRSGLEAKVYAQLLLLEAAGEIKDIKREQSIQLTPSIKHKIDFTAVVVATGKMIGIEAKGATCPTWSLKKRLYKDLGAFLVQVWTSVGGGVAATEIIDPGAFMIIKRDTPKG